MNNTTVFRTIRSMLIALFSDYYLKKYNQCPSLEVTEKAELIQSRNNMLQFVDKGTYGMLRITVVHTHSLDTIKLQNANCDRFNKHISLDITFDFSKEVPTLNYVYVDTTLKISRITELEFE